MKRIRIIQVFFGIFAFLIIGRAVQLQLFPDERLAKLASRQFNSKLTALPRRGYIFDRNGEGLASSLKAHSLFFRPEIARRELTKSEKNRVVMNVAKVLHEPVQSIASKLMSDRGFVWVKRQLTDSEEKSIREHGLLEYGEAVGLAEETKRFYPNKELAAHVLGAVNVDGVGLEGLELFYDGILNGERTRINSKRDAMGRKIFQDGNGLLAFKDGQSLVLTIDKAIQYETEKHLRLAIEAHQAKAGTAIVAEVETGEILAMANYPTFNSNNPKASPASSRRNRAITDTYEPGSTIKPFIVGAALERGRPQNTKVYCERGSFTVADRKISEAESHEKYEWLTYGEVIKLSSNIGAAKIALELGPAAVGQLVDRLGVSLKTDIDLPGEVVGSLNKNELNSPVRLANVGFGHGIAVTPLQMLTYYLALANNGKWLQPKIVKAILSEDPESLERGTMRWKLGHRFDSANSRKIFSPQVAVQLKQMLKTVTEEKGTGTQAQLTEWPVAGKTGTSQKIDPETKRYSRSKYMASFAGFAPADQPRYVAIVILDEPSKSYYGGETAAPAFREIMRATLLKERVPASNENVQLLQLANRSSIGRLAASTEEPRRVETKAPEEPEAAQAEPPKAGQFRMPNLAGLSLREALKELKTRFPDVEVHGTGRLKEQLPRANEWTDANAKVRLTFTAPEE